PVVIEAEGLSKRYRLGQLQAGYDTLRDSIAHGANRLLQREHRPAAEEIWALDGVSFTVEQGEVLGVIGPNGAGKSTLLKILTRITTPTRGGAVIRGRVGSLLERRCLARMEELSRHGRTVLFVSHQMQVLARLCDRAILLREGRVVQDGPSDQVVAHYLQAEGGAGSRRVWPDLATAPGGKRA